MIKNTYPNSSLKLFSESSLFSWLGACIFKTMILNQQPLRTIYDILSLTNSTLLIADTFLWCTKILFPNDDFRFLFHKKIIPCSHLPPLSHLTCYAPNKSNLNLAKFRGCCKWTWPIQATNIPSTESHVPFPLVRSYQPISPVPRHVCMIRDWQFLRLRVVSTSPNIQAGGPSLAGSSRLLIEYIRRYPLYWRPLHHPQPEDDSFHEYKSLKPPHYAVQLSLHH